MTESIGIGARRAASVALTGFWLALAQVSLAFALIAGAGATALFFFALMGIWLAGGAVGGWLVRGRAATMLLGAALIAATGARTLLWIFPFSSMATAAVLIAGCMCGAYAGAFLAERSAWWGNAQAVLLHENNGFVLGWIVGALLLIVSANVLALVGLVLGLALLTARLLKPVPSQVLGNT